MGTEMIPSKICYLKETVNKDITGDYVPFFYLYIVKDINNDCSKQCFATLQSILVTRSVTS